MPLGECWTCIFTRPAHFLRFLLSGTMWFLAEETEAVGDLSALCNRSSYHLVLWGRGSHAVPTGSLESSRSSLANEWPHLPSGIMQKQDSGETAGTVFCGCRFSNHPSLDQLNICPISLTSALVAMELAFSEKCILNRLSVMAKQCPEIDVTLSIGPTKSLEMSSIEYLKQANSTALRAGAEKPLQN